MSLQDIADGTSVFVDANVFVYCFQPHAVYGSACADLLDRIERKQLQAITTSQVLSDVAHRLMSLESMTMYNWGYQGIATRMNNHPKEVMQLHQYVQAIQNIFMMGIEVLSLDADDIPQAIQFSKQYGLLMNDALILLKMHLKNVSQLASFDTDFDRVPFVTRFGA